MDAYDTEVELDDSLETGSDLDLEEELDLDPDMAIEPAQPGETSELTDIGDSGPSASDNPGDQELFEAPGVDLSGDDSKED